MLVYPNHGQGGSTWALKENQEQRLQEFSEKIGLETSTLMKSVEMTDVRYKMRVASSDSLAM